MCELFGISCARKRAVNRMLSEFFSHGDNHPHGWGMALFDGSDVQLEKQPVNSCESAYLQQRLESVIEADTMVAHIRLATQGIVNYDNTHPFVMQDCTGRAWTQVHNGTIYKDDILREYETRQRGGTDSERILLHIVNQVNARTAQARRPLDVSDRFAVVDTVIREITPDNKVNLLLYDGELLYVHSNLAKSLYQSVSTDGVVISTKPLVSGGPWRPVPRQQLVAYRKGTLAAVGTRHNNEFIEPDNIEHQQLLDYAERYLRPAAGMM